MHYLTLYQFLAFLACVCAVVRIHNLEEYTTYDVVQGSTTLGVGHTKEVGSFLSTGFTHKLEVTLTTTYPRFLYLHPTSEQDIDQYQLVSRGVLEPGLTALWIHLTKYACQNVPTTTIVDIGVNFGYFTTLSSMLGCRVIGFEPISLFQEISLLNVASLNSGNGHVKLVHAAVDETKKKITLCRPDGSEKGDRNGVILGTAGLAYKEFVSKYDGNSKKKVACEDVHTVRVDDIVKSDVCFMKIDVEGMEYFAIKSSSALFKNHIVHHVVLEFSPALTNVNGLPTRTQLYEMLETMHSYGYKAYELDWGIVKTNTEFEKNWESGGTDVIEHAMRFPIAKNAFSNYSNAQFWNTNIWFCKTCTPC
jgi:FkbM family methyltransferase